MNLLRKLFNKPELKVTVFHRTGSGRTNCRVLQVDELKSRKGVYVIDLDNRQSIRVEVEK